MPEVNDIKFMRRCLELAALAEGMTYPNPMVGSVVVHNSRIIGEGFHRRAGSDHAEVIAINGIEDKSLLKDSILYVSLEPCSHYGMTPPCSDFIVKSGIPKVVVGTADTSARVSGKGIEKLRRAGVEVVTGICEDDCRRINRRFFSFHEKGRPYITLKWAKSADGFIDVIRPAGSDPGPFWITGRSERVLVHRWRSEEEAILIGGETARNDRPRLNVRLWSGRDPLKLILSGSGETGRYIAENETKEKTITFTYNAKADTGNSLKVLLTTASPSSAQIADFLYKRGIQSLFVEGGAKVLAHFIETGSWDEARIFTGHKVFGEGIRAPGIAGRKIGEKEFRTSYLEILTNEDRDDV